MGWPVTIQEDKAVVAQTTIQRYLDGERIEDIANQYGVTRIRLYQILVEQNEEGWKSAQLATAIERLEKAKALMDSAEDTLNIARARESARLAQWDLERVCKRIYGTDAPPQAGQGVVAISINFSASQPVSGHTIDQSGSAAED